MATSPAVITLTGPERAELGSFLLPSAENRQRERARIVLAAARGEANQKIADDLQVSRETVRKWRGRYAAKRLAGLKDLPRCGRPAKFTPLQRAEVKAIACSSPSGDKDLPLARWSVQEIADQAVRQGAVESVARMTVARWLAQDLVKPWRTRSWISPRDPHFARLGGTVLDLYQRVWDGRELHDTEYVVSADEKPGVQALRRGRAARRAGPGWERRVEFDYARGGTLAYLAAMDVHAGNVMGVCGPTTGIVPFRRLVDLVMSQEPYASAEKVYWVCDNGSSHRGEAAQTRLEDAYPNAVLVHTPVHASWLNQIEVYFSILSRKALNGESFGSLGALEARIIGFQDWYNQTAQPFDWKWTRAELDAYLKRLGVCGPAA
jgi:transposase